MFRKYLDKLCSDFLVVGGLYDRHQRFLDAALFHPALRKTDLTIKVLRRHFYSVLDRDDVKSGEVLKV